jgi:ABC-type sugar transport system substrate-binding protein
MGRQTLRFALLALGVGAGIVGGGIGPSFADGIDEPFRAGYHNALNGKAVVFVPVAQGVDLAQGWFATMKKELEPLGMSVTVRDPNFNSSTGAQAIENLINERPAVLVVQNPDVQTYAKLLQRAEQAGIFVIQLNMRTSYNSTAFVGVDWVEMGEKLTEHVVKACEGKSGKIAILQGALSAAASAYTLKGIENVLATNKQISVVSNQAADWDASKAKAITQTVLKQHPDLCGIIGFWDGQDIGTAAAIKEAGLTNKVFLITSGGSEQKGACDMVKSGAYDMYISYSVPDQGRDVSAIIKWLLQSGVKAGADKGSIYTTLNTVTKANVEGMCWTLGK